MGEDANEKLDMRCLDGISVPLAFIAQRMRYLCDVLDLVPVLGAPQAAEETVRALCSASLNDMRLIMHTLCRNTNIREYHSPDLQWEFDRLATEWEKAHEAQ